MVWALAMARVCVVPEMDEVRSWQRASRRTEWASCWPVRRLREWLDSDAGCSISSGCATLPRLCAWPYARTARIETGPTAARSEAWCSEREQHHQHQQRHARS